MSEQAPVVVPPAPVAVVPPPDPAVAPPPQPGIYKNEGKDVLGDVLKDASRQAIDGETGTYYKPQVAQAPVAPPAVTPPVVPPVVLPVTPEAVVPPVTPPTVTPPAEKLIAGKFKSAEELEAAYLESEKALTRKSQELAEAKKVVPPVVPPVVVPPLDDAARKAKLVNEFLADPERVLADVQKKADDKAQLQRNVDNAVADWKKANPDIAAYDFYVGAEMQRLSLSNPELAKDSGALLTQATTNFRAAYGTIRELGKKEALSVQASVTPLSSQIQIPPPTEQPNKAPMTQEQATAEHMSMLLAAERRRKGIRA